MEIVCSFAPIFAISMVNSLAEQLAQLANSAPELPDPEDDLENGKKPLTPFYSDGHYYTYYYYVL